MVSVVLARMLQVPDEPEFLSDTLWRILVEMSHGASVTHRGFPAIHAASVALNKELEAVTQLYE